MFSMQCRCTFSRRSLCVRFMFTTVARSTGLAPKELRHVTSSRRHDTGTRTGTSLSGGASIEVRGLAQHFRGQRSLGQFGVGNHSIDCRFCGGCCLGCQYSSFGSLHVLHELRDYMLELLGAILHVLVCSIGIFVDPTDSATMTVVSKLTPTKRHGRMTEQMVTLQVSGVR